MAKAIGTAPNQIPTNANLGTAAYRDSGEFAELAGATFTDTIVAPKHLSTAVSDRVKLGVWSNDDAFGIGMGSSYTYGYLNDFAMTFLMTGGVERGWWWGTTSDTNAQGSMSLTNDGKLHVDDSITVGTTSIPVATVVSAPATAADTGSVGQIAVDADYIYVCTATDTWKRVAIATW